MFSIIVVNIWRGVPFFAISLLAGLQTISPDLNEAAAIDGATPRAQFWRITVPHLSPIIFFNLVVGVIGAFQEFDRAYVVTTGANYGPGDSLLTPVYYLFANGFSYFKMGYASAIAWVIFSVVLLLTLVQLRVAKRWVHYEGERE